MTKRFARYACAITAFAATLAGCSGPRGVLPGVTPAAVSQDALPETAPDFACPKAYRGGVELVVHDHSGLPAKQLAVYYTSSVPSNLSQFQFLARDGRMVAFAPRRIAARFPLARCFPGSLAGRGRRFTFPLLPGGRIWIVFGTLPLRGKAGGQFGEPVGWVRGQFGFKKIWDVVEMSANNPGIFVNLTRVTMLGLPMTLTVLPRDKTVKGSWKVIGEKPGKYDTILQRLRSDAPFGQTVILVPGTHVPRVINPSYVPNFPDVFNDASYYAGGFLNAVARYYQTTSGITYGTAYKGPYCPGAWSASSNGSAFSFTQSGTTYTYPNALYTTNYILSDNPAPGYVAGTCQYLLDKILLQELNRGVAMSTSHPDANPSSFYPAGTVNNQYACVLHNLSLHHATYAFAYDDAANQASTITNTAPKAVVINILAIPKRLPKPLKHTVCTPNY